MKKRFLPLLLAFFLISCNNEETIKPTLINKDVDGYFVGDEFVFPLNTITTLSLYYQDKLNEVYPEFSNIVTSLSKEVDRYYNYESIINLKTINDSCGENQELLLSDSLFEVISLGVELTKLTEGRFNIAIGTLIDLYAPLFDYNNNEKQLPTNEELNEVLLSIPSYTEIDEVIVLNKENKSIILNQYNEKDVIISVGALAKGFVMQKAYDYLKEKDCDFYFNAGSSTIALHGQNLLNRSGSWRIGIANPSIEYTQENYVAAITLSGTNFLSTSGDYQQCFSYENENNETKLMHHILDPYTGISNNFIRSVSLISPDCSLGVLDALSTTLFNSYTDTQMLETINLFEQTFNCSINYLITKPYEVNNYNDVNLYVNEEIYDDIDSLASNVKNYEIL